ncbi:MAG: hypothetical protein LCH78_19885 [Proteobacteria bacterium]|nr:hypothetical protein [Pseudomonadota bacterium]
MVETLAQSPAGRVFLANLHHALAQSPAQIDHRRFRDFWTTARGVLPAGLDPRRAREALFELFYAPVNLGLRFGRPPQTPPGHDYVVHTAITPYDLLHHPDKAVLDYSRVNASLPRDGRPLNVWTPDECRRLAALVTNPAYWSQSHYAHRYGIFWATPSDSYATADATTLRDAQGLVHVERDEPLIQLTFACTLASPTACAAPTVIEATYHRRFKARPVSDLMNQTAANLEALRRGRILADGAPELTLSSIPMTSLTHARYAGHAATHADLDDAPPTPANQAANDEVFSNILVDGRLGPIKAELTSWLEASA